MPTPGWLASANSEKVPNLVPANSTYLIARSKDVSKIIILLPAGPHREPHPPAPEARHFDRLTWRRPRSRRTYGSTDRCDPQRGQREHRVVPRLAWRMSTNRSRLSNPHPKSPCSATVPTPV